MAAEPTSHPNVDNLLLDASIHGDLEGIKALASRYADANERKRMLLAIHQMGSQEGTLLHFAIANNQHHIVTWLWHEMVKALNSAAAVQQNTMATFFAFYHRRYQLALLLLSLGASPNQQDERGNTLLHLCCDQAKPPLEFLRKFCRLRGVDPNLPNEEGCLPVHLLCMRCNGLEGKEVMTLLKALGTDLDAPTRDGRTPAQLTRNAYIREALALQSPFRRRLMPRLPEEEESQLAETTLEDLLGRNLEVPRDLFIATTAAAQPQELPGKSKKLSTEDQEEIVDRLYTRCMKLTELKREATVQKYVQDRPHKQLSAEEMEEFTQRHFYDQEEQRETRRTRLQEKYVGELVAPSQLSGEEMTESVQRLYGTGMENTASKMKTLHEKYVISRTPKKVRKSPAEIQDAVKILYDKAVATTADKHRQAKEKYCAPLTPYRKLTLDELKASANRLYGK
eukprot:GGOE01023324.1.p1 GENE.GGOE01023324.1~~GGOE01023324.1.p1  ORF type:complete len:453 (+),score=128.31 GGOE01023324.1:77-1435(+)